MTYKPAAGLAQRGSEVEAVEEDDKFDAETLMTFIEEIPSSDHSRADARTLHRPGNRQTAEHQLRCSASS